MTARSGCVKLKHKNLECANGVTKEKEKKKEKKNNKE